VVPIATEKELEILVRMRNLARQEMQKLRGDLRQLAQEAGRLNATMRGAGSSDMAGHWRSQTQQMSDAIGQQRKIVENGYKGQEALQQAHQQRAIDAWRQGAAAEQSVVTQNAEQRSALEKAFASERVAVIKAQAKEAIGSMAAEGAAMIDQNRSINAAIIAQDQAASAQRVAGIQQQATAGLQAIQAGNDARLLAEESAQRSLLDARLRGIQDETALREGAVRDQLSAFHGGLAAQVAAQRSAMSEITATVREGGRQQLDAISSLAGARIAEVQRSTNAEIAAAREASRQLLGIKQAEMEADIAAMRGLRDQDAANIEADYLRQRGALESHLTEIGALRTAAGQEELARLRAAQDIALAASNGRYAIEEANQRNAFARLAAEEASFLNERVARYQANGAQMRAVTDSVHTSLTDSVRRGVQMQTAEISRGFQQQMAAMHNASREWEQVSESLFMAGATLTAAITAPVVLGTKAVIGFGSSFEDSMAGVAKTTYDASLSMEQNAANVDQLGAAFVRMSTTIPATREEIARVAEIAGQLGIVGTDNILKFTDTVIRMAESSNLSIEQAADGMARLANVMGLPTTEIDHLGNTIAGLGIQFAATESDILNMSFRIAAAGRQAGFTNAEIIGLAAGLSSLGVKAEQGGSAVSRVIKDITKWAALGGAELEALAEIAGMSADEFATAWGENAHQAFITFLEGLQRAGQSGADALQFLDDVGLDGIRVSDVLLRASGNVDLMASALAKSNPIWEQNSELVRISENRFKTLSAQWQMAKNEISAVALALYDRLRPALIGIVHGLADAGAGLVSLAGWFADLPAPILMLAAAFVAVAAAIGPLMIAAAGLAAVMAGLSSLAVTLSGLLGVTVGVGALAGGIAAVAGAVSLLGAAVVLLVVYWDDLNRALPNTMALLTTIGGILLDVGTILGSLALAVAPFFEVLVFWAIKAIETLDRLLGKLLELQSGAGFLGSLFTVALGPLGPLATLLTRTFDDTSSAAAKATASTEQVGHAAALAAADVQRQSDAVEEARKSTEGLSKAEAEYVRIMASDLAQRAEFKQAQADFIAQHKHEAEFLANRGQLMIESARHAALVTSAQDGLNISYDEGNQAVAAYFAQQAKVEEQLGRGYQARGRMIAELRHEANEMTSLQNQYEQFAAMTRDAFKNATLEELPALIDAGLAAVTRGAASMRDFNTMMQSSSVTAGQAIDALKAKRRELELATLALNPALADEAAQIAANVTMLGLLDEAIRRAAEGAFGYANAIANAHTVHAGFDAVLGALNAEEQKWSSLKSEAEKHLAILDEMRATGPLSPEQEHQWEQLSWLVGRAGGAITDDLAPAQREVLSNMATWYQELDRLNGQLKDNTITQEQYDESVVGLARQFNGALDPAGNLATNITLLRDAINDLAAAILGLPDPADHLPPEINSTVNLNTADFDKNLSVTRDEAMDFDQTVVSATVGADVEPARGAYQEATKFWQEYANSNPMTTVDADIQEAVGNFIVMQEHIKRFIESQPETQATLDNVPFMGVYNTIWEKLQTYINSNPTATLYANDQASAIVDALAEKMRVLTSTNWSVLVSVGYNDPGFTSGAPGDGVSSGGGGTTGGSSGRAMPGARGLQRLPGARETAKLVPTSLVELAGKQAQNAQNYVEYIKETVRLLADAAASMGDADESAKAFAESAKVGFEALLAALEFIEAIGDDTLVLAESHHASVEALNHLLYKVVKLMAQNAESIAGDYLANGKLFAEAAQAGSNAMLAGLEFLVSLDEQSLTLTERHHATLEAVNHLLYKIVRLVSQNAESLSGPGLEAGKVFAEAAGAMVGLLSTTLDFFIKLHEATKDGVQIMTDINSVVVVLATRSRLIADAFLAAAPLWEDEIPAQAQAFADGVGAATSAMMAVVDLFSALHQAAEDGADLSEDINSVVVVLATRARLIADAFKAVTPIWDDADEVASGMQAFADGVSAAVGGLVSVLDLLTKLLDLTTELNLSHAEIETIAANLAEKAVLIAEAFKAVVPAWAGDEGIATQIGNFSNAVSDSNAALNDTLEFLGSLATMTTELDLTEAEVQAAATQLADRALLIAQAFGAASDSWQADAHPNLVKFAEAAGASLEVISQVGDALSAILEFGAGGKIANLEGKLAQMVDFVRLVIREIERISVEWQEDGAAAIGDFAESAGKSVALVGDIAEAMTAIAEVSKISQRQVATFVANFQIILDLVRELNALSKDYLTDALEFQATAEAIAAAMQAAAEAIGVVTGGNGGSGGGAGGGTGGSGGMGMAGGPLGGAVNGLAALEAAIRSADEAAKAAAADPIVAAWKDGTLSLDEARAALDRLNDGLDTTVTRSRLASDAVSSAANTARDALIAANSQMFTFSRPGKTISIQKFSLLNDPSILDQYINGQDPGVRRWALALQQKLVDGLITMTPAVTEAVLGVTDEAIAALAGLLPQMQDGGAEMAGALAQGLLAGSVLIEDALTILAQAGRPAIDALITELQRLEQQLKVDLALALLAGTDPSAIRANIAEIQKLLDGLGATEGAASRKASGTTPPSAEQIKQGMALLALRREAQRIPKNTAQLTQAQGDGTTLTVHVNMDGKVVASTVAKQVTSGSTLNVELI
jgi:TP901 family phage tail tape measure protein